MNYPRYVTLERLAKLQDFAARVAAMHTEAKELHLPSTGRTLHEAVQVLNCEIAGQMEATPRKVIYDSALEDAGGSE